MDPIVLDPGHGGAERAGRSSPQGRVGPGGTEEKAVALELASRVRDALAVAGVPALLTREGDENPTLRQRTFVARSEDARAFVSLHLDAGGSGDRGCEVWVHERASGASRALAEAVLEALGPVVGRSSPEVRSGPLAVLDPRFLPADAAACLVTVDVLANPEVEAELGEPGRLEEIAAAIARGIAAACGPDRPERENRDERGSFSVRSVEETFDVWHEVPLVQQLTGMSCWAAAAAMLVGWRDCVDVDPAEVAQAAGRWEAYRDGLMPGDVQALAGAWGLRMEPPQRFTEGSLRRLLEENGPLWVGEASPGLHVVVVTGMAGDGTPEGTKVRINDPWPVGEGERYSISFAELRHNLETAAGISGVEAQVLHTGGRGASRSVFHQRSEVQYSVSGSSERYGAPAGLFAMLPVGEPAPADGAAWEWGQDLPVDTSVPAGIVAGWLDLSASTLPAPGTTSCIAVHDAHPSSETTRIASSSLGAWRRPCTITASRCTPTR